MGYHLYIYFGCLFVLLLLTLCVIPKFCFFSIFYVVLDNLLCNGKHVGGLSRFVTALYDVVLDNLLCKGKHVGGLSHFDIALYNEDQGVDFYSSSKQRSRESMQRDFPT